MGSEGKISPAVKKETIHVLLYTVTGTVIMWIVLFILNRTVKDFVPFDYTVILAGVGGTIIATLNFFLMGLTVQKIASEEDEKKAAAMMRFSFTRRMLLQILWLIAVLAAPCFYWVAGFAPLLFPSIGIKLTGIIKFKKKTKNIKEVDGQQDEH